MSWLSPYWRRYRVRFSLGILFVFVEAICELLQPRIMSLLVDEGALAGDLDSVRRYALLMLLALVIGAAAALSRNRMSSIVSQSFAADLRLDLFTKIQTLSVRGLDSFAGGSLITRMTNDVAQLQHFTNGAMRMLIKAPFVCLGAIFLSASLGSLTVAIIAPIIAAVVIVVIVSMQLAYPRFARMQKALDGFNTAIREYLSGIRLVKAFRRFREEERRFSGANDKLTDETVAANRILAIFSPFMALFVNLGIVCILILGDGWVDTGKMRVGEIMAFITYLAQILQSLNMISMLMNMLVRVRASTSRVGEIFNTEPGTSLKDYEGNAASDTLLEGAPTVQLRDICFRYENSTGQSALRGLTFSAQSGETIGVIGPTGSGKTTLAALLMRFYEPTSGEIAINGKSVADIPEGAWRSRAAIVPQSPTLFTGSVRENLLWGREDATDEELREAARAAEALGFVEDRPGGFDLVIGQGGVNLSGGQKQRLSIARALVRKPGLLILDDCTSALDLTTEARVRARLFEMPMTTVYITQRVSTARRCDRILVLDAGTQAGFGTHEELMASCGVYRDIYASQIGGGNENGEGGITNA